MGYEEQCLEATVALGLRYSRKKNGRDRTVAVNCLLKKDNQGVSASVNNNQDVNDSIICRYP